jgi:hypothetical protein
MNNFGGRGGGLIDSQNYPTVYVYRSHRVCVCVYLIICGATAGDFDVTQFLSDLGGISRHPSQHRGWTKRTNWPRRIIPFWRWFFFADGILFYIYFFFFLVNLWLILDNVRKCDLGFACPFIRNICLFVWWWWWFLRWKGICISISWRFEMAAVSQVSCLCPVRLIIK